MSFEREAMPDTSSSPIQQQSALPIMKEERTINPYQQVKLASPAQRPLPEVASVEPKAPEETVRLSPQMAALAKREQKFRQQQAQLEQERKTLASEREEIAQLKAMKAKLAAKDYSALDDMINYDEYSQYQVNKLNEADPVQDEIKRLNSKISEIEKSTQDNVTKQFEAAVSERRIATKELVDTTDQFPRIKKAKAHEAVVQHILDTWEHDSEELSIEQAAKEVEEILVEKAKQWAKLLEDEKVVEAEPTETKKPLPTLKPSLKTLTNNVTSSEATRPRRPLYGLSDSERWAEARRRSEEKLQLQTR